MNQYNQPAEPIIVIPYTFNAENVDREVAPVQVLPPKLHNRAQVERRVNFRPNAPQENAVGELPVAIQLTENTLGLYDQMTELRKITVFWELIIGFQWKGVSEGFVNAHRVRNIIGAFTPLQSKIFADMYEQHYNVLQIRMETDGMFVRNNITTPREQAKYISHVIAMGRDVYDTMMADLGFLQVLIEFNECQSLDVHIPINLQH